MSAYREPTPFDDPYLGASSISKNELSRVLESVFYSFEHQGQAKTAMSQELCLNEKLMLHRAKEIGGKIYFHTQELMQASTDYANGHGKIEKIYKHLEFLRDALKS